MRVAVFGAGRIAGSAFDSLRASGVTDLSVFAVERTAIELTPGRWAQDGMVVNYVDRTSVSNGQWLGEADVCLLASDSIDASLCLDVNLACIARRVVMIPGLGMGEVAHFGPRIDVGTGPCLRCVSLRVEAALGRPALIGPYPPDPELCARVGQELASIATGSDDHRESIAYIWADGRREEHFALRSRDCPDCRTIEPVAPYSMPATEPPRAGQAHNDQRILNLEATLVDPIMGVIRWVTDYVGGPDEPDIAHAVASVVDSRWAQYGSEIHAGGNDLDPARARAAALGEALDRLASSPPALDTLMVGRVTEFGDEAIDPRLFDLYHDDVRGRADFPYGSIDPHTELHWLWAWSFGENRPKLVPASQVFLPLETGLAGDAPDGGNLSGAATGSTPASAILSGVLEVIERDSFMIAWANSIPMTGLEIDQGTEGEIGTYVAAFNRVGVDVRCSTTSLDWEIPMVVAQARSDRAADPAVVISAAADTTLAKACRRALKELSANLAYVRGLLRNRRELPPLDPHLVRTPEDHALLYANPAMRQHLERWWRPEKTMPLPTQDSLGIEDQLHTIVEQIVGQGSDVLAVDLTLPGLASRGLWTYKTLVPGAYPMNFDSAWPQLGGKRILNAPVAAGIIDSPRTIRDLNRVPHPFP